MCESPTGGDFVAMGVDFFPPGLFVYLKRIPNRGRDVGDLVLNFHHKIKLGDATLD